MSLETGLHTSLYTAPLHSLHKEGMSQVTTNNTPLCRSLYCKQVGYCRPHMFPTRFQYNRFCNRCRCRDSKDTQHRPHWRNLYKQRCSISLSDMSGTCYRRLKILLLELLSIFQQDTGGSRLAAKTQFQPRKSPQRNRCMRWLQLMLSIVQRGRRDRLHSR